MKSKATMTILAAALVLPCLLSACGLAPKKGYPGPELPREDLALIVQTENLEYRPVYVDIPYPEKVQELPVDDLGVVVRPGTYAFRAKWYHARLQEERRIATLPVVPGESDFPVERSVMRWTRGEAPYKETGDTPLTVEAGRAYEVWCPDDERIRIKLLGPYR